MAVLTLPEVPAALAELADLKKECEARGLRSDGDRYALVDRLKAAKKREAAEEARAKLLAAERRKASAGKFLAEGQQQFEEGNLVKAAALFEEALDCNPENKSAIRALKILRTEVSAKEKELEYNKKQFLAKLEPNRRHETVLEKKKAAALLAALNEPTAAEATRCLVCTLANPCERHSALQQRASYIRRQQLLISDSAEADRTKARLALVVEEDSSSHRRAVEAAEEDRQRRAQEERADAERRELLEFQRQAEKLEAEKAWRQAIRLRNEQKYGAVRRAERAAGETRERELRQKAVQEKQRAQYRAGTRSVKAEKRAAEGLTLGFIRDVLPKDTQKAQRKYGQLVKNWCRENDKHVAEKKADADAAVTFTGTLGHYDELPQLAPPHTSEGQFLLEDKEAQYLVAQMNTLRGQSTYIDRAAAAQDADQPHASSRPIDVTVGKLDAAELPLGFIPGGPAKHQAALAAARQEAATSTRHWTELDPVDLPPGFPGASHAVNNNQGTDADDSIEHASELPLGFPGAPVAGGALLALMDAPGRADVRAAAGRRAARQKMKDDGKDDHWPADLTPAEAARRIAKKQEEGAAANGFRKTMPDRPLSRASNSRVSWTSNGGVSLPLREVRPDSRTSSMGSRPVSVEDVDAAVKMWNDRPRSRTSQLQGHPLPLSRNNERIVSQAASDSASVSGPPFFVDSSISFELSKIETSERDDGLNLTGFLPAIPGSDGWSFARRDQDFYPVTRDPLEATKSVETMAAELAAESDAAEAAARRAKEIAEFERLKRKFLSQH